jgi:ribosomal protein S18 acetylase RimI-like enzyme
VHQDLDAVASLHCEAFPATVIGRLGAPAARRYYARLLQSADTIALGAEAGGALVGFLFAGPQPVPEAAYVKHNALFLATRLLLRPRLLADPFVLSRIASGGKLLMARRGSWGGPAEPDPQARRCCHGLYLAVRPSFQHRGLGRTLLAAGEAAAHGRGYNEFRLSERTGWIRILSDGQWKGFMYKPLPPSTAPA